MNNPIRVLVAAPGYDGRYDVRFLESITNTILLCAQNNIEVVPLYLCYDSLVQRVRNNYFRIAYENGFDVLFFVDSDMGWKPKDFLKLVLSDKDMIGGGYRKKHDNEELYTFKVKGDTENTFEIVPDDNGLLEVNGLGCGFLKMTRNCFGKLFENESKIYTDGKTVTKMICDCVVNEQGHFISEDILLGFKWQSLGGKVYVDTNIDLIHVGNKEYVGSVKRWLEEWQVKFGIKKQDDLSVYFKKPLIDDDFKVL